MENWDFLSFSGPYPGEKPSLPWTQARTHVEYIFERTALLGVFNLNIFSYGLQ